MRVLPVAVTLAIASGMGPLLAVKVGNKAVVAGGLVMLGGGFFWVSFETATIPYGLIVGQMILLGLGLGLSTAPATEAIMGVVKPDQAGAGSAVNDATRLVGATLGVAVVGSVAISIYRSSIALAVVPAAARQAAQASYATSHAIAATLPTHYGEALGAAANRGFLSGLHAGCDVCAGVCLLGFFDRPGLSASTSHSRPGRSFPLTRGRELIPGAPPPGASMLERDDAARSDLRPSLGAPQSPRALGQV